MLQISILVLKLIWVHIQLIYENVNIKKPRACDEISYLKMWKINSQNRTQKFKALMIHSKQNKFQISSRSTNNATNKLSGTKDGKVLVKSQAAWLLVHSRSGWGIWSWPSLLEIKQSFLCTN